jgi:hypothetical protein
MGGKSRDRVEIQIRNEISTRISNTNKTVNDLLTQTMTKTAAELINETETSARANTGGVNSVTITGGLNLSKKAKFSIDQVVNVQATNTAAFNVVNDQKLLSELGTKMTQDLTAKITNDSAAASTLAAANQLNNAVKNAGGPEGMLASAMGAFDSIVGSLTGKETDKSVSQKIENKLGLDITNVTINENAVKNIVEQAVNTMIKNMSKNNCDMTTAGGNEIVIEGGVVITDEAEAQFKQVSNVVAVNKCITEQATNSGVATDLTNDSSVITTTDTSNKSKSDASMSTKNTGSNVNEQESVINTAIKAMSRFGTIMVFGVVIVICIVAYFLFKSGGVSLESGGNRFSLNSLYPNAAASSVAGASTAVVSAIRGPK